MHSNRLPKSQRLYQDNLIGALFNSPQGKFVQFPFCVLFKEFRDMLESPAIIPIAPKKRFKHAVDRNRVKRQIRDIYRRNSLCGEVGGAGISILFLDTRLWPTSKLEPILVPLLLKVRQALLQSEPKQ